MSFESINTYCDKSMLYTLKVLKRLHLGKTVNALLRRKKKKKSDLTYSMAQEIMHNAHPKLTDSSVFIERDENWNKGEVHYNLTVVIPTYNCADYLMKCLRSLLAQKTEYSWQAIVVNDGATDDTAQRLRRFEKHPNIKIITQENRGLSGARNTALHYCSSDYTLLLDSDDLLAKNAIQNLLSYAYANDLDIVEGNYLNLQDGKLHRDSEFHKTEIVESPLYVLTGFPWMKTFKTELFRTIQFPEGYLYEDTIVSFLMYPLAGKCGTIEDVVYYYRRHGASLSFASKGRPRNIETFYIAELMYDCMKLQNIDPAPLYELFLSHVLLSGNRMAYCEKQLREAVFVGFCELHEKYYSNAENCSKESLEIRECLLNKDFGRFDLLSRLN